MGTAAILKLIFVYISARKQKKNEMKDCD